MATPRGKKTRTGEETAYAKAWERKELHEF